MKFDVLWDLCIAMDPDFLKNLAAQLPAEFTADASDFTAPFQERIMDLEEANKLLNAKLYEVMVVLKK